MDLGIFQVTYNNTKERTGKENERVDIKLQ